MCKLAVHRNSGLRRLSIGCVFALSGDRINRGDLCVSNVNASALPLINWLSPFCLQNFAAKTMPILMHSPISLFEILMASVWWQWSVISLQPTSKLGGTHTHDAMFLLHLAHLTTLWLGMEMRLQLKIPHSFTLQLARCFTICSC